MRSPRLGRYDRFVRFALVGGTATAIQYAVLVALVEWIGVHAVRASSFGYGLSAVFSYLANYRWTFASDAAHRGAAARFVAMIVFGLALNAAVMWLLYEGLGVHYVAAQVVATGIGLFTNYLIASRWVYAGAQGRA